MMTLTSFPGHRGVLVAAGVDPAIVQSLCVDGIPESIFDEIQALDTLELSRDSIVFAKHISLGPLAIDRASGNVRLQLVDGPLGLVNTSVTAFTRSVRVLYDSEEYLSGLDSDDLDEAAELVIYKIGAVDPGAVFEGGYWDSVRESISIGDWSEE